MNQTPTTPFPWDESTAPEAIRALPRDARGLPIPYSVTIGSDGKPDFRVLDQKKVIACIKQCRCQLCGNPLGYWKAFIGGPGSIESKLFTDPAMHPECAEFALKTCPMMAAPKFAYARHVTAPEGTTAVVNEHVSTERPEVFMMGITRSFGPVMFRNHLCIAAAAWKRVETWRHGVRIA